jgi:hypothetical protein
LQPLARATSQISLLFSSILVLRRPHHPVRRCITHTTRFQNLCQIAYFTKVAPQGTSHRQGCRLNLPRHDILDGVVQFSTLCAELILILNHDECRGVGVNLAAALGTVGCEDPVCQGNHAEG